MRNYQFAWSAREPRECGPTTCTYLCSAAVDDGSQRGGLSRPLELEPVLGPHSAYVLALAEIAVK